MCVTMEGLAVMPNRTSLLTRKSVNDYSPHYIYIVSGLPAIGKSHRAHWWEQERKWHWIECDAIRAACTGNPDCRERDTHEVLPLAQAKLESAIRKKHKYIVIDDRNDTYSAIRSWAMIARTAIHTFGEPIAPYQIHWCLFEVNLSLAVANQKTRWNPKLSFGRYIPEATIVRSYESLRTIHAHDLLNERLIDGHLTMQGYREGMRMIG